MCMFTFYKYIYLHKCIKNLHQIILFAFLPSPKIEKAVLSFMEALQNVWSLMSKYPLEFSDQVIEKKNIKIIQLNFDLKLLNFSEIQCSISLQHVQIVMPGSIACEQRISETNIC